jgi:hypothetical protein
MSKEENAMTDQNPAEDQYHHLGPLGSKARELALIVAKMNDFWFCVDASVTVTVRSSDTEVTRIIKLSSLLLNPNDVPEAHS